MLLEWLLVVVALGLGLGLLGLRERLATMLAGLLLFATAAAALVVQSAPKPAPSPIANAEKPLGFATSSACRSCHPAQYSSWHASFHRSMTQRASLEAVAAAPLRQGGRLRIETGGRAVELEARGATLWARLPDPGVTSAAAPDAYAASFASAPIRDVPVRLLTGSHHHQGFWVAGARAGELVAVPAVYSLDEQRLIARREAFLNPPDAPERTLRWNANCIQCHSVAGAPEHDERRDAFASSAAELGIACEACHGAGDAHVRAMQNPLTRYRAHGGKLAALGVVNPKELSPARGSEVCGRCHAYFFPRNPQDWWQNGFRRSYAPGADLSRAQLLLSPELLDTPDAPVLGASAASLFYADGTIRVGGREYNGLTRSACFQRGHGDRQLACTSCHSLHRGAPDDQLDPEKLGNRACAQCHSAQSSHVSEHTHHAASSSGSLCYNCHMPHVSYALLGAIRSHRVDSPSFGSGTRDRPNACNLCHLEQSEAWAAEHARAWYGDEPGLLLAPERARAAPAGAVYALSGDAAVRAVTAAALGRHESSNDAAALRAQLLAELERDDYAAVQSIARRAQRNPSTAAPPLPASLVDELLAARDRRPVSIAE